MSIPNQLATTLRVELSFDPVTPGVVRARFVEAIRTAVIDAATSGEIEMAIAEECLAALPTWEPRT